MNDNNGVNGFDYMKQKHISPNTDIVEKLTDKQEYTSNTKINSEHYISKDPADVNRLLYNNMMKKQINTHTSVSEDEFKKLITGTVLTAKVVLPELDGPQIKTE